MPSTLLHSSVPGAKTLFRKIPAVLKVKKKRAVLTNKLKKTKGGGGARLIVEKKKSAIVCLTNDEEKENGRKERVNSLQASIHAQIV